MLVDELPHGKQLSESATLTIIQEILTGLKKVHSHNVIHRDLKPENIIRRRSDLKLVLIDFGAVKQIRAASAGNQNTIISQTIGIGTPGYMPTEQGIGSPKLASDVYAVGAIAVQCLTGSHPYNLFDNDTLQLEWRHLCQVNRDVVKVIERMVSADYRQRYANATEALDAIESLISPISPPQQQKVIPPPAVKIQGKKFRKSEINKLRVKRFIIFLPVVIIILLLIRSGLFALFISKIDRSFYFLSKENINVQSAILACTIAGFIPVLGEFSFLLPFAVLIISLFTNSNDYFLSLSFLTSLASFVGILFRYAICYFSKK